MKRCLKLLFGCSYISLTGINFIALMYHSWSCVDKATTFQIWLTVALYAFYGLSIWIYAEYKHREAVRVCKANMRKLKIK